MDGPTAGKPFRVGQTWFAEYGQGPPAVLLHPGGVDARSLQMTVDGMSPYFRVYTPERRGHGRTPDVDGPMSYEAMAEDTIAFLEANIAGPVSLVGCSDGAVVALAVALRRPDLVSRLVCVAGVFHRSGWMNGSDAGDVPDFIRQGYGELSPDGAGHFDVVMGKLNQMHATGPTYTAQDLAMLPTRTLIMIGDDDEVSVEHATAMYRALPQAELAVVPGTSHGLLVEKPELCNLLITDFLTKAPVPTFAPIRRAPDVSG
jgi:pimeloyl-ACP methyl ester carboxylesterase